MGIADELERLKQLHDTGELNDAEYADAKAKVLSESESSPRGVVSSILGGENSSLTNAATTYINFRIVMGIIGFIIFLVILLGAVLPSMHP